MAVLGPWAFSETQDSFRRALEIPKLERVKRKLHSDEFKSTEENVMRLQQSCRLMSVLLLAAGLAAARRGFTAAEVADRSPRRCRQTWPDISDTVGSRRISPRESGGRHPVPSRRFGRENEPE